MVLTQYFDLDIVKPSLNRLRLVNGDTANTFVITIKENGAAVTLDASLHKIIAVFKRADGEVYTQDATTGLSFTTGGVVTIDLRPASFRTGTNKITLQIYKRENSAATEYPLLLTTQEQSFNARAQAIPDAGAPNAPSQLPMLEQIIHDAGEAVTNCNTATADANAAATAANNAASAANSAASAANSAASAANDAATDATNAANAAWIRVDACNIALANVLEATTAANNAATSANNASTSATNAATSANSAASSANTAAAAANAAATAATAAAAAATAAAKKNFYNVKHDTDTWTNGQYQTYTDDTGPELAAIAVDSVFSSQVELPSGKVVTVYETHRHNDFVYFMSESIDNVYVTAEMLLSDSGQSQLQFTLHTDESPLTLHVSTITFDEANPIEFADEYDILSVDFAESKQTLFDAIGVRPIEVILPFGDKYYRLHTIGTFIDEGQQRTEKTVELAAAGDLLRTVPGALSNAYMSLTVTPHAPGYLLNASGYVVITES